MVNHYIVGKKQFIGRAVVKGVGPGRGEGEVTDLT